jgi:hypothetical protein
MEIPRHWRLKAQRYRLEGSVCPSCGKVSFPPRSLCAQCTPQPIPIVIGELSVIPSKNRIEEIASSKRG